MCAVLKKFFVAFDGNGDEDFGFGFGSGDVEGDIVEVGYYLINRYWGCPLRWSATASSCDVYVRVPRESLREEGLDEHILVVEEKHCGRGGALDHALMLKSALRFFNWAVLCGDLRWCRVDMCGMPV